MKIIFVTESLGAGGAERVISNLANSLIKKYDIEIVINSNEIFYEIDKKIKIHFLVKNGNKFTVFLNKITRIFSLRKILKKEKPDVVISFLPKPSYRTILASIGLNHKIIISERNNPGSEYNNIIKRKITNFLYNKADGMIFQTNDQKEFFKKLKKMKTTIIPNPLKEEFLEENEPYLKKEKIILNVGRLHNQKNQEMLIKSFKVVHEKYPDYILNIFGNGPLKNHLLNIIKNEKLENYVNIKEPTNNIKNEMRKADIFVLSSNYEGMPNCLIEAMSCGTACISTDCPCGGPRYIIKNEKNGLLTNVNDQEMLSNKMLYLIKNKSIRNKIEKNARKIKNELNPNKINKKWECFIKEVIDNEK